MYAPQTIDDLIIAFLAMHETRKDVSKTFLAITVQANQILKLLVLISMLTMIQKVLSSPQFLRSAKQVVRFECDSKRFLWGVSRRNHYHSSYLGASKSITGRMIRSSFLLLTLSFVASQANSLVALHQDSLVVSVDICETTSFNTPSCSC
jgi:hypothetical protein